MLDIEWFWVIMFDKVIYQSGFQLNGFIQVEGTKKILDYRWRFA